MSRPLLVARGLQKSYRMDRTEVKVLRGASLSAERGQYLVVTGASGSGKSTLLHLLGALDVPDAGSVEFDERNVFDGSALHRDHYRNRHVGFVFQFYHLLPELSVVENVMMPRMVSSSAWHWLAARRPARRDAEEVLGRVGLSHRVRHRPAELSGGERQRAAIARALINRPLLLLADEPTGNLDERIGGEILKLLAELNQQGQTIIMVTHDERVAANAHRRVRLFNGVIHEADGRHAP